MLAQVPAPFTGPSVDWYALSPLLVLVGGGVLFMLVAALVPRGWPRGAYAFVTACLGGAALTLSFFLWHTVENDGPQPLVGGALMLDNFSVFVTVVLSAVVLLSALVLDDYLRREGLDGVEVYALLLMSVSGGIVMAMANDLVVLFLGLETLSLAMYVMAASHINRLRSQEAGLKYFILGGFSSAFLLYGIALVYGATGSTNLSRIADFLSKNVLLSNGLLLAGFGLLLVGFGFKVSAVPFHEWSPDVYQGAPSPVSGFLASAAKAAAFAAMLRVFVVTFANFRDDWRPIVGALALLTLIVGSFLAIVQTDVKRMMAYSSISHAGFILVGVYAASADGISGALFYVFAYAVMIIGTFGVITLVGRKGDGRHTLDTYRGLSKQSPLLAVAFTTFLLAQAGVPFTTGFIAKFGVIGASVEQRGFGYVLGVLAMLAAVVAAFLYLRIIVSMFLADPDPAAEPLEPVRVPTSAGLALLLAVAFTLVFGIEPGSLIAFARHAVPVVAAIP